MISFCSINKAETSKSLEPKSKEGGTQSDEKEHHSKEEQKEAHDHEHEEEHEEENASIGPDKGIVESDEEKGFKLSSEAIKNFGLSYQKLSSVGPWTVPRSAILFSGEEINIYRMRNGYFKRIDFTEIAKDSSSLKIRSDELKEGDEVVTKGIGFLRAAEIVASGDAPEGHHH